MAYHSLSQNLDFIYLSFFVRFDIEIVGISADGDQRLLSCMKFSTKAMMNQQSNDVLMNLSREQSISYVQDIIHFATKIRNRLLKFSIMLPMGDKQVSVTHLKILLQNASKEIHGLVATDINPYDRQNYASFQKITEDRALKALEVYVPDSEATIIYLKLSRSVVQAYNDVNLSPLDRVYNIFHALYFFRAWKKWIKTQVDNDGCSLYNVENNFITPNAFDCLELNAYNMLHLITKFRNEGNPNLFLPGIFNSQGCEHTFRHFRAMSTANYTKINFTLYELLHMIGRVELKNEIENSKLTNSINFPRLHKPEKHTIFALPSNEEIKKVLEKAHEAALLDATKFGMTINTDIRSCELVRGNIHYQQQSNTSSADEKENDILGDLIVDYTCFRDYSESTKHSSEIGENLGENGPFVHVINEDCSSRIIKKSAIVWLLTESKGKLSSDRLKRVQSRKEDESNGPKRIYLPPKISNDIEMGDIFKLSEIKVGEWCIFFKGEARYQNLIAGNVLSFKYLTGNTEKQKQYSLDVAPVKASTQNPRGILVSGLWYSLNEDFTLQSMSYPSFFINIKNYVATINTPQIDLNNKKKIIGNVHELKIILSLLLSQ